MRLVRTFALVCALAACGKNETPNEKVAAVNTVTIPVDGMACEKCAARVKRTLTALDGVGEADVSLDDKRVVVHFDRHRLSPDRLVSAIDAAGFKAGTPAEAPP